MRQHWLVALVGIAVQACGGASEEPASAESAATPGDVDALCAGLCDHQARCATGEGGDESAQPCPAACSSDFGVRPELVQQRVVRALRDCYRELACDSSDDVCIGRVLAEFELGTATPLVNECLRVQDQCGGFNDDFCTIAAIATPSGQARVDECLSSSCERVPECIEGLAQ